MQPYRGDLSYGVDGAITQLGAYPQIEHWGLAPLLFLKIMADNKKFRAYVDNQVTHRINQEKSGNGPDDIFKLLLNYKNKETGESMDFKELSDEAVVLIIAGNWYCSVIIPLTTNR